MGRQTPLFATHQKLGARLIDFGGWDMPVQYTSIIQEHQAVRHKAGIFDISHMGEILVGGAAAAGFLNSVLSNDARKIGPGQGQYTLMCNERGGVVDDLYLYCLGSENYLLMVNASRIDADFGWLAAQREKFGQPAAVSLENKSDFYSAVAIQGPAAASFIDQAFPAEPQLSKMVKNEIQPVAFRGESIYASRTGYTGEDGFEVIAPAPLIGQVWEEAMLAGRDHGLEPCGLGARDTLRLEACYPLYGHELNEATTPVEAGLGFFVALDKGPFTGSGVLAEQKRGTARKVAAFKMTGKAPPPRADYPVFSAGPGSARIGQITSGTQSPTFGVGLGLANLAAEFSQPETPLEVEIRGSRFPAVVVKKPFYKRSQPQ